VGRGAVAAGWLAVRPPESRLRAHPL